MARRTAPPSRARAQSAGTDAGRVDVREWIGGVRFSAFTGIMLGLVVLAVFVLVPTVGTYIDQRQQIAALHEQVAVTTEQVEDLQAERERWADPAYVTAQARERLYYVTPGEVVYLVDNDLPDTAIPADRAPAPEEVGETTTDWMSQLVRSVAGAGLARSAAAP